MSRFLFAAFLMTEIYSSEAEGKAKLKGRLTDRTTIVFLRSQFEGLFEVCHNLCYMRFDHTKIITYRKPI